MIEDKAVSLWVGHADSSESLRAYLRATYSEDGDFIQSPFARDFGIRYYDEDFAEAEYFEEATDSLRLLLRGYSYEHMIVQKFVCLCGETLPEPANVAILLYRFAYSRLIVFASHEAITLKFMGSAVLDTYEGNQGEGRQQW
jgi:hypothetical protein